MKAKAVYLINQGVEVKEGREAWIVRTSNGLAIGTIYDTGKEAAELDNADIGYLQAHADRSGAFILKLQ